MKSSDWTVKWKMEGQIKSLFFYLIPVLYSKWCSRYQSHHWILKCSIKSNVTSKFEYTYVTILLRVHRNFHGSYKLKPKPFSLIPFKLFHWYFSLAKAFYESNSIFGHVNICTVINIALSFYFGPIENQRLSLSIPVP